MNNYAGRSGAGVASGTRYRYIGDEPLVPLEQAGSAGGNTGAQTDPLVLAVSLHKFRWFA